MLSKKKIIIGWILITLSIIGMLTLVPREKNKIHGKIRLGVSDDTSGFIINYMQRQKYFENSSIKNVIEPASIRDC